jgi:phenylalanyl-tRNA synthetase beta chain
MRFSVNHLAHFLDQIPKDISVLSKQLINLGIEVESVTNYSNNENVIEVSVAPNRADLLGMVGIARELAAINNSTLKIPYNNTFNSNPNTTNLVQNKININILSPKACPKYYARTLKGINTKAKTPSWIEKALDYAKINLISPVVDLANYVMLELGQPLHTFDLDLISGSTKEIQVRFAEDKEKLILLNNNTINLSKEDLIISDCQNPLALAGIMGGVNSAINKDTSNILIECAYFEPIGIRKSAARHNLLTDACQRFSRGIDPTLADFAIHRFSELLIEVVGGVISDIKTISNTQYLPKNVNIDLYQKKINAVLGINIQEHIIVDILGKLGMKTTIMKDDLLGDTVFKVAVPNWRQDLKIQEDLIEELARFYGYNNIPKKQINLPLVVKMPTLGLNFSKELQYKNCLANRGYKEAISYSFIDPELAKIFYPDKKHCELKNPISTNMSIMRPGLLAGLFSALMYNQNRQQDRVRLFELGNIFTLNPENNNVVENKKIAAIAIGKFLEENWKSNTDVDFFNLKSDVLALLMQERNFSEDSIYFQPANYGFFHPFQSANIYVNEKIIGFIGALHPKLSQKYSIVGVPFMFELDLDVIRVKKEFNFVNISKFPSIRRDFSVILDYKINFNQIKKVIHTACDKLLKKIILFDVYIGNKLPEGKKSIAFGVLLQSVERTLAEEEINNVVTKIINKLQDIGVYLRT